eukprot:Gregarina_sp_Pseudo_9__5903@NODE_934_length_2053_cov_46_090864_g876_i0_p1_GENE_NODE_934_length_2053_cov_46_090864_g876_i0NODE_934_length_2053_cov_46_090864_g876_i0_p1_ORF_typecomplete_len332_score40_07Exo_endo_phos/PF03372_23/1_1e26Exo_endo_phos_2/PF14529_6/2_3e07_NODE_934_length_2053_cov_46_090864_g876_i010062001
MGVKRKRTAVDKENEPSETQDTKKTKANPHVDGKGPPLTGDWKTQIEDTPLPEDEVKVCSWNVNGLRAVLKSVKNNGKKSDLESYILQENPDVLCLNETKIDAEIEDFITEKFPDYSFIFAHSNKKGYAGVAVMLRKDSVMYSGLEEKRLGVGDEEHDSEGRSVTLIYPKMCLVASYVANAGQGLKRLDYRVDKFDPSMQNFLKTLETDNHRPVIWCGDLNVAYEEIDIWNSKGNQKSAGHTPQERASFGAFLGDGDWVDIWRAQNPTERRYTYWSARFAKARSDNLGWRLDYFVASKSIAGSVGKSYIRDLVQGSDHCPIVLYLKRSLFV